MGSERFFGEEEIIVSKTNTKGIVTYANNVFVGISGFTELEIVGAPHNLVRHEDMPRCVFKLLWEAIQAGEEIFAYVKNKCKNGDFYWVYAHVTPTFDEAKNIIGYHSNRRVPERQALDVIIPLYQNLLAREREFGNSKTGMEESYGMLVGLLRDKGLSYERFILSLLP